MSRRHRPRFLRASHRAISQERAASGPEGYMIGVTAVRLLREQFPAFFQQHVAARRLTPQSLLGAAQACFALITKKVEMYEIYFEQSQIWGDPLSLLDVRDLDDRKALEVLVDEVRVLLDCPGFCVYGVMGGLATGDMEPSDLECHVLALALCQILDKTAWRVPDMFEVTASLDEAISEQIFHLPQLPPETSLPHLCIALDREWTVGSPWPPLGSLLRFVFTQTGNEFADLSSAELLDMIDTGYATANLFDLDLDCMAEEQQIAREWRAAYDYLAMAVLQNPDLLTDLARTLIAAAESLKEQSFYEDPNEDTAHRLFGATPLEAPPRAAVPA